MIALDVIQAVRDQVADELQFEEESSDRIAVYTPFMYADGDRCWYVLARDPDSGLWHLSDEGDVLAHASYQGVDLLSEGHRSRFRSMIEFYGLDELNGQLLYPIKDSSQLGDAFFTFSQACLDIGSLAKLPAECKKIKGGAAIHTIAELIATAVPSAHYVRNWHHPEHDPQKIYGVDCRIEGRRRPLYMFGIRSEIKCFKTTITCLHYMRANDDFESIAVFENEEAISDSAKLPVADAVSVKFSATEEQDEIRDFLRDRVA